MASLGGFPVSKNPVSKAAFSLLMSLYYLQNFQLGTPRVIIGTFPHLNDGAQRFNPVCPKAHKVKAISWAQPDTHWGSPWVSSSQLICDNITGCLHAIHTQSLDLLWQYLKASGGGSLLPDTIQRLKRYPSKVLMVRQIWNTHEEKKKKNTCQTNIVIKLQSSVRKRMFSDCLDLKLLCERENDLKEDTRKGRTEYNE